MIFYFICIYFNDCGLMMNLYHIRVCIEIICLTAGKRNQSSYLQLHPSQSNTYTSPSYYYSYYYSYPNQHSNLLHLSSNLLSLYYLYAITIFYILFCLNHHSCQIHYYLYYLGLYGMFNSILENDLLLGRSMSHAVLDCCILLSMVLVGICANFGIFITFLFVIGLHLLLFLARSQITFHI